jgi:trk system potassium uptake protein TrkH
VAIIFMILGALPFVLYLKSLQGNPRALFRDSQVQWFFAILCSAMFLLLLWRYFYIQAPFEDSLLHVAFSATAVMTGTGYSNVNYGEWSAFPVAFFFFLMVVGGCAGSTTCGIKIFRFQVLYAVTSVQIKQLLNPHGVFVPMYNKRPIPSDVPIAVMSFFFLYALSFSVLAVLLSMTGLDYITAMSASASAISNVGPGLGPIVGPAGNFATLSDTAKWLLSIGMILGRLELFTVMVMLLPRFWRS